MATEFPLPLPDDPPSYVEAWIRWQITVHQALPAQVADLLNRAHVPPWENKEWTGDMITRLVARPPEGRVYTARSRAAWIPWKGLK
jgi:hypothetical protein